MGWATLHKTNSGQSIHNDTPPPLKKIIKNTCRVAITRRIED